MPTVIDDTAAAHDAINSRILDDRGKIKPIRTPVGIIASVLAGAGVRATAEDAFWSDWQMLEQRGDFTACRQPGDYLKVYLRLKLQQAGG